MSSFNNGMFTIGYTVRLCSKGMGSTFDLPMQVTIRLRLFTHTLLDWVPATTIVIAPILSHPFHISIPERFWECVSKCYLVNLMDCFTLVVYCLLFKSLQFHHLHLPMWLSQMLGQEQQLFPGSLPPLTFQMTWLLFHSTLSRPILTTLILMKSQY